MATAAQQRAFYNKVWSYCKQVASATGLSPCLFLCQWAFETGYGTCTDCSLDDNNYAGLSSGAYGCADSGGTYCKFSSLQAFTTEVIKYLEYNKSTYFEALFASAGQPLDTQMYALGESPWAGSHYGSPAGADLLDVWANVYSNYGLACGVTAQAIPTCPGPYCELVTTPPPPKKSKSSGVPAGAILLLLGGGAAIAGYEVWSNPGLPSRILVDVKRDERRGVAWVRGHL